MLLYLSDSGGEGAGLAMALGMIFLVILIVTVTWCASTCTGTDTVIGAMPWAFLLRAILSLAESGC
jgi:hypothetical protein